ncbi:MAG: MBOAT family protein [Actinomycetes bacterium]|jgi:D-alanyl-lipoteichoic acid acyltransferase DltB (MBOAT superfamily)|nr:MBOAT family protein [Actinomycetes bacterium]
MPVVDFFQNLVGLLSFSNLTYLVLLALAAIVYYCLPGPRTRGTWLLLLGLLVFMLFTPAALWVIVLVTLLGWGFGLLLDRMGAADTDTQRERGSTSRRRAVFIVAILAVLASLLVLKYANFGIDLVTRVAHLFGAGAKNSPTLKLLAPVGISFWTFQSIAYLTDVYWGKTQAVKNLFWYSLSVLFFPILTMGPITRVQDLVAQLSVKHRFHYERMQSGLLLLGWGFFKKLMVADALAVFVNTVFDNPRNYSGMQNGLVFAVAAVFFAIQLYCDFSGYTDIVRGSARLFDIDLPLNFRAPYFSRSVGEFWRRWHITLMDWLHDYVWLTVLYSRPVKRLKLRTRKYLSVMVTFLVSGIWHGAGLTYVLWGVLNGGYQVAGEVLKPVGDRIVRLLRIDRETFAHKLFQTLFTFGLITLAWVLFRANSLTDAAYIVPRMFMPTIWIFTDGTMTAQGLDYIHLMVVLLAIVVVFVFEWFKHERAFDAYVWLCRQHLLFRWAVYYGLIFTIVIFGHYGGEYSAADFVYFKF